MTLASVVIMSCFSAIFQGSFVATASMFPSRNMHYYATGQSAAGLYAVIAQILSLTGQLEPTTSALYYFMSANVFLIVTLGVFLSLPKYVSLIVYYFPSHSPILPQTGVFQLLGQQQSGAFSLSSGGVSGLRGLEPSDDMGRI